MVNSQKKKRKKGKEEEGNSYIYSQSIHYLPSHIHMIVIKIHGLSPTKDTSLCKGTAYSINQSENERITNNFQEDQ